jgi:hypothetical protein
MLSAVRPVIGRKEIIKGTNSHAFKSCTFVSAHLGGQISTTAHPRAPERNRTWLRMAHANETPNRDTTRKGHDKRRATKQRRATTNRQNTAPGKSQARSPKKLSRHHKRQLSYARRRRLLDWQGQWNGRPYPPEGRGESTTISEESENRRPSYARK